MLLKQDRFIVSFEAFAEGTQQSNGAEYSGASLIQRQQQ